MHSAIPRVGDEPWRVTGQHAQVECNAPLALARCRLEWHPSLDSPGSAAELRAAEYAAAERLRTIERQRAEAGARERCDREILKRLATAARHKRSEAARLAQQKQKKPSPRFFIDTDSNGPSVCAETRPPPGSPDSVIDPRIELAPHAQLTAGGILPTQALPAATAATAAAFDTENGGISIRIGSAEGVRVAATWMPVPLDESTNDGAPQWLALVRSQWSEEERLIMTNHLMSENSPSRRTGDVTPGKAVCEATWESDGVGATAGVKPPELAHLGGRRKD